MSLLIGRLNFRLSRCTWLLALLAVLYAPCAYAQVPGLSLSLSNSTIPAGATITLTVAMNNATAAAVTVDKITIGLPGGALDVNATATPSCGGTKALGGNLVVSNFSIPASSVCTIALDVGTGTPDVYTFSIAAGDFQTSNGNNAAALSTNLTVVTPIPPTVAMIFSPSSITAGRISTLTLTLDNPDTTPLLLAGLGDTLPSGIVIANPANAATNCPDAQVNATPGGTSVDVSFNGIGLVTSTIPAQGSCTASVAVTSSTPGIYTNTIPIGALQTQTTSPPDSTIIGLADNNVAAASATLSVIASPVAAPMLDRWALLVLITLLGLFAAYRFVR